MDGCIRRWGASIRSFQKSVKFADKGLLKRAQQLLPTEGFQFGIWILKMRSVLHELIVG